MTHVLPELSFDSPDDPLAILRCATAISHSGASPRAEVTTAAREALPRLESSPPAGIRLEMEQALIGRNVHLALQWLHEVGAMAKLLPELEATVDFSQESGRKHKD